MFGGESARERYSSVRRRTQLVRAAGSVPGVGSTRRKLIAEVELTERAQASSRRRRVTAPQEGRRTFRVVGPRHNRDDSEPPCVI